MSKDVIRTVAGLVVVGLAVIATFLYGNHQSQDQIRKTQTVEQQKQTKATPAKPAPAPVAQPALQAPASQPQPVAIPQTGSGLAPAVLATTIGLTAYAYIKSRKSLKTALLGR